MITTAEIKTWLYHLSPADKAYKSFYLEHGCLLPLDELDDFRPRYLSDTRLSPVRFLDASYFDNTPTAEQTRRPHLSNASYFKSNEGISIKKHTNYFPSFRHTHDFMEVCYVLQGSCHHLFYPDRTSQTPSDRITLEENDLLIIPPDLYHAITSASDSVIINIMVKRNAMGNTLSQFLSADVPLFTYFTKVLFGKNSDTFLLFRLCKNDFLEELLYSLMFEYCNRQPLYPQIMSQTLGLFFSIIQRDYGNSMKISSMASSGTDYIPKFLLYLQSHYADFSMNDMALNFYLSPSYISRIFKKYTNNTIISTLQGIRLETAKSLLHNTDLPVNDIAASVGYEDVTYFIRIFKKAYSSTPAQFRTTAREQENSSL